VAASEKKEQAAQPDILAVSSSFKISEFADKNNSNSGVSALKAPGK